MPYASEFRSRARAQMNGGIFSNTWLLLLVGEVIAAAILSAVSFTFIGTLLLAGPLYCGLFGMYLKRLRSGEDVDIVDIFVGFRDGRFGKTVILGLLQSIFIILWTMLLFLPGLIKTYSYSMAYYISLDNPDMDSNACITESRKMMDGYKWRLFCLDFSFIGWYILGMLACGIGTLWVIPYHHLARANFYEELCRNRG